MKFLFSLIIITIFFCSFLALGFSKNRVKAEEKVVPDEFQPDGIQRIAEDEDGLLFDENSILWASAYTVSVHAFPFATIHRARGDVESKFDRPYFHGSWGLKAVVPGNEPKNLGGPFTGLFSHSLPDVNTQIWNKVDIDGCEAYGVIQGNNNVSNESFQAHAEIPFGDDNGGANNNADASSPGLHFVGASTITINGEKMVDAAPDDTVSVDLVIPSDKGYSMIYWYLASPDDSGYGSQLGSPTTSSSSAIETSVSYGFTLPSNASGVYKFTAYIYPHSSASDYTVYEYSFKIYVS